MNFTILKIGKIEIEHACPKRKSLNLVMSNISWNDIDTDTYDCHHCGTHTDYCIAIPKCGHCGKRHHIQVREIDGTILVDKKEYEKHYD